jgi:hypothetical protein
LGHFVNHTRDKAAVSQSGLDMGLEQAIHFLAGRQSCGWRSGSLDSGQSSALKLAMWQAFGGLGFQAF